MKSIAPDNSTFIQRFQAGDRLVFQEVFNLYVSGILFVCKKCVLNDEDAMEITSDTFCKLFLKHCDFESLPSIHAFLKITSRNACLNFLGDKERRIIKQEEMLLYLDSTYEPGDPESDDIQASVYNRILNEIDKLPPQAKEIFKLFYFEHYTEKEIAKIVDRNINIVKSLRLHAIKLLKIKIPDLSPYR